MTKERIEDMREVVLPFISKRLKEINYEGKGESDSEEFTKDFTEILDFAKKGLSDNSVLEDIYEEMRQEYEDYSARNYYNTAYGLYCAMGIVKNHMESENNKLQER